MLELFKEGGPIMWPILILSIVTLGAVIERGVFFVVQLKRCDSKCVTRIFQLVEHGQESEAEDVGLKCSDPVAEVLTAGLTHREVSYTEAMMEQANTELDRYNRGLVILDTAVTLGPLLGLLGTVIGMIQAFGIVGGADLAGKTSAITGGIAESLIAVTFGLGVAILAIIPLNYLNARLEKMRRKLESAMTRMELLLVQSKQQSGAGAAAQKG